MPSSARGAPQTVANRKWAEDQAVWEANWDEENENVHRQKWGRNSSLVVCWAWCPAWSSVVGLILLWGGFFSGRGNFPLELTRVLTPHPLPLPPPTPSLWDESINRGLVCAHMHSISRPQRIPTFMSKAGECRQQKHTQHAQLTKTKCDYLNGWLKNGHMRRNLTQNGEPQRYSLWAQKKKKEKKKKNRQKWTGSGEDKRRHSSCCSAGTMARLVLEIRAIGTGPWNRSLILDCRGSFC